MIVTLIRIQVHITDEDEGDVGIYNEGRKTGRRKYTMMVHRLDIRNLEI